MYKKILLIGSGNFIDKIKALLSNLAFKSEITEEYKPGETSGCTALDHIREIVKYLKKDCLDYVIISDNSALSKKALLRYSKKKQLPVRIGDISQVRKATKARIIIADIAHETELIRHDSRKIRDVISRIMKE